MSTTIFICVSVLLSAASAQYGAPSSPCGPRVGGCSAGLQCQAARCVQVTQALYAPQPPMAPLHFAPPPPAPLIAAQPPMGCAQPCIGNARCFSGSCYCPTPEIVYSPVIGCAAVPLVPAPVLAGRLIPQGLPGAPCEPGVECTGGSQCSYGVCTCPPELTQQGTVCVARTVYGVVPPQVIPVPVIHALAILPVGAPCLHAASAQLPTCVRGASCSPHGTCACQAAYAPVRGGCMRRRFKRSILLH